MSRKIFLAHTSSGCDNGEQLSFSSATVAQRVIVKEWGATDHHGAAMVLEQEGPLISISLLFLPRVSFRVLYLVLSSLVSLVSIFLLLKFDGFESGFGRRGFSFLLGRDAIGAPMWWTVRVW